MDRCNIWFLSIDISCSKRVQRPSTVCTHRWAVLFCSLCARSVAGALSMSLAGDMGLRRTYDMVWYPCTEAGKRFVEEGKERCLRLKEK